jgi:hypothetical protein
VLWVVGQTVAVALTTLILDSRVWESLDTIKWDSRRASGSRRWGDRYRAYLEACDAWAKPGFTAEDVEYTLFSGLASR